MAYEKQTWTTGEVITQEKLNHMEQGIEDGANGYECGEEIEALFEGNVNLYWTGNFGTADVTVSAVPSSDTVTVVLDGETIELPRFSVGSYGDFSNPPIPVTYPINLSFANNKCSIYANVSGEHTIAIQAPIPNVTVTECFERAVTKFTPSNIKDGSAAFSLFGANALPEGNNYTLGKSAVALGQGSKASGNFSVAVGFDAEANAQNTVSIGWNTVASGEGAYAEGHQTEASGEISHAEGWGTKAAGDCSHAQGGYTKAESDYQHVEGKYNVEDTNGIYAHIIGNGTSSNNRSNAFAIKWDGTLVFADGTEITPAQFAQLKALLNQ